MNVHGIQAQASDAEEVCALYLRAMDGWNQGSGDAFAAPFAEACDFVAFDGVRFRSREAIARTIRHYSLENSLIYLKQEDTYATVRGPGYVPSYDRYDGPGTGNFHADAMSIVIPQKPAPGKPWMFHPTPLERDSKVDLALLAKGYHIVLPPISGPGAVQTCQRPHWIHWYGSTSRPAVRCGRRDRAPDSPGSRPTPVPERCADSSPVRSTAV